MTMVPGRHTAKIYTFPAGGRASATLMGKSRELDTRYDNQPVYSGAHYHDAALREADRNRRP